MLSDLIQISFLYYLLFPLCMADEEKAYQMMKDFAEQNPAVMSVYKIKDNNEYAVFTAPPKVMF